MDQKNFLTKALKDTVFTRRSFLKWSAALGGTAAMIGGVNFGLRTIDKAAEAGPEQVFTVGCYHNCGGRCILGAVVKDGTVTRLVPDPTTEETPGNPRSIPCLRGRSQTRRVYAADRLKYPLKRVGKRGEGRFKQISWDEAIAMIAARLKAVDLARYIGKAQQKFFLGVKRDRAALIWPDCSRGGNIGPCGHYASAIQATAGAGQWRPARRACISGEAACADAPAPGHPWTGSIFARDRVWGHSAGEACSSDSGTGHHFLPGRMGAVTLPRKHLPHLA